MERSRSGPRGISRVDIELFAGGGSILRFPGKLDWKQHTCLRPPTSPAHRLNEY